MREHTVFTPCAHKSNRPRDYPRYQQLIVECRRTAFLVWVDLHMLLFQRFPVVIGTLTELPIGIPGLGKMPLGFLFPVRTGGLYFCEVRVRVATNSLFGVVAFFVGGALVGACRFSFPLYIIAKIARCRGHF